MKSASISIGELPDDVLERAVKEIEHFCTPLLVEGKLVGSGTFIKCNAQYGILTAHHVVHNPHSSLLRLNFDPKSKQKLGLALKSSPHCFELETRCLNCIDVGIPKTEAKGPDISVLLLPEAGPTGTIKALKSFWDISFKRDDRLNQAQSNHGVWMIAGMPACKQQSQGPSKHFDQVICLPGLGGATGVYRRFKRDGFDYLEVKASYSGNNVSPESFGGMSGGGVWRIPLKLNKKNGEITFSEFFLAGVMFYQTAKSRNSRLIRCHAASSIYERTYDALGNQRS